MKDKPNDLVPWLKKLQETLARVNPDDDPEEFERRSHLARSASSLAFLPRPQLTLDMSLGRHRNTIARYIEDEIAYSRYH